MNPVASPTPYDIVGIPTFPFIPPTTLWLLLASIAAVSYLLSRIAILKSAHKKIQKLSLVLRELEKYLNTPPNPEEASLISILVKRYLASESGRLGSSLSVLPTCTEKEMIELQKVAKIPEIQKILECLITLESIRFQKDRSEVAAVSMIHSNLMALNARGNK